MSAEESLPLTLAVDDYDQVRDLLTGRVVAEGIRLRCLQLRVEEIFHRFTRHAEWDVSEMSAGRYLSLVSRGDRSFTAIPVFPSRVFRHGSIYLRAGSGINRPADLAGRAVGVPEWAQTATVYARGMLVDDHGLDVASIRWVQAGLHQPGRVEPVPIDLPGGVRVQPAPDRSLDGLLAAGEVDAVISAHPPQAFVDGDGSVVRLLPDHVAAEREYWQRTGIFPIMHMVCLRREIVEQHPWIAANLTSAFEEAKRRSVVRVRETAASRLPLPWAATYAADAASFFEGEYWPYGVEANRRTLEAFVRYATAQGVAARAVDVEDLFWPTTLTTCRV